MPLLSKRFSKMPLPESARSREFPVESRPPAETETLVPSTFFSIFGASVSFGVSTSGLASGGGAPVGVCAEAGEAHKQAVAKATAPRALCMRRSYRRRNDQARRSVQAHE